MKTITVTALGVAAAVLIAACALLEGRLARVTTPEIASAAITVGCTGGREFIETAIAGLDPAAAALIVNGVETACAIRAERTPISSTVYDTPLDGFCAEIEPLETGEADASIRAAFNARRDAVCVGRQ